MVHGRKGLQLEALKFALYLALPITASVTFNDPRVQRFAADYFQFLKVPANANVNLREEFEELAKKRRLEKEQRQAYAEQVRKIQESAQQRRERLRDTEQTQKRGKTWFNWLRFRRNNISET
mmetsp:Transcript_4605/g.6002  ORF Transcript_4605/g.6002 Transcript_4605/m.6002 type:complete len:122 (+) Transcript_4605:198-563(+)